MHWYNSATRVAESVGAPYTDEEAEHMLRGYTHSWAFLREYERLREDGVGIQQAMIFVGHRFRMWRPGYQPARGLGRRLAQQQRRA
jgi:hypothetical protein